MSAGTTTRAAGFLARHAAARYGLYVALYGAIALAARAVLAAVGG